MFKNVAGQKLVVYAYNFTTGQAKTGDSANITAYVSIDGGAVTVLGDTSATEKDATNAAGYYQFDLTQAETNGDALLFTAKSSTSNIAVVGVPAMVYTTPANFTALVVSAGGVVDANAAQYAGVATVAGAIPAVAAGDNGGLLKIGTNTGNLIWNGKWVITPQSILDNAVTIDATGTFAKGVLIKGYTAGLDVTSDSAVAVTATGVTGGVTFTTSSSGSAFKLVGLNGLAWAGTGRGLDFQSSGGYAALFLTSAVGFEGVVIGGATDDIKLVNSSAPTLRNAVLDATGTAAIATAWGTRDLGDGRTADMYLQGLTNRIEFAANGLSYTVYSTDDVTPLVSGVATRLGASVGGLRSVDPA